MEFENRTVMITGAASGMGQLSSHRFAQEGAHVVMIDVNKEALEAEAEKVKAEGGDVLPLVVDVRDWAQVEAAAQKTLEAYGSIDVVINYAGGSSSRIFHTGPFCEKPIDTIDWCIDVNFRGPIYMARATFGQMLKQERGVFISLGSVTGWTGGSDVDYPACKSGLSNGLTKSLAVLGAPHNVRAVAVSPGPVLTRPAMAKMTTAMGRASEPREIVDVIMFLASDKASSITGTDYLVDLGRNVMPR